MTRPPPTNRALTTRPAQEANLLWAGRQSAQHVLEIAETFQLAQLDRALLDTVVAASPQRQREIARWAVRRAFTEAGLTGIRWIDACLDALDRGNLLPRPFHDPLHAAIAAVTYAASRVGYERLPTLLDDARRIAAG